jgi:hypothetical protein
MKIIERITIALVAVILLAAIPSSSPCITPADKPGDAKKALASLLPKDNVVGGWKKMSEPLFYQPENLWDYINGAAELYLDYGFKLVVTVDYESTIDSIKVAVEIYQMETALHGFGIYAAERSLEDNFVNIGAEGYVGDNLLHFWKGPYYVKVTSFEIGGDVIKALGKLARAIAGAIPGEYAEPEAFAYFPAEGRVSKSGRYIPKNFLGHPFFKGGYRVDYKASKVRYQLFLVPNQSPEDAENAFLKYRDFLESQKEKTVLERKDDYQMLRILDGKAIFQHDVFVGGLLDGKGEVDVPRLIDEFVANLKTQKRAMN